MKKIVKLIIISLFLIPSIVFAGGEEDDRVFTTTFETGYEYGNVKNVLLHLGLLGLKE